MSDSKGDYSKPKPKDYSKVEDEESKGEDAGEHGHGQGGHNNAAFSIWLGILIDGRARARDIAVSQYRKQMSQYLMS